MAAYYLSYTVLTGNLGIFKNKGTSLWNFAPNTGLKGNFASAYRSSKRVIDLLEKGGRSERDKLDRRRSTELTVPPSSDARLL